MLPEGWCLALEPPYGQLSIGPLVGRRRYHRGWLAVSGVDRLMHDDGRM